MSSGEQTRVAHGRRFANGTTVRVTNAVDMSGAWSIALAMRVDDVLTGTQTVLSTADSRFWIRIDARQLAVSPDGFVSTSSFGGTSARPDSRYAVIGISKEAGTAVPRFHRGVFHRTGSGSGIPSVADTTDWIVGGRDFAGDIACVAWIPRVLTDAEWERVTTLQQLLAFEPVSAIALDGDAPRDLVGAARLVRATARVSEPNPLPGWWTAWPTVDLEAHGTVDLHEWSLFQKPDAQTTPVGDRTVTEDGSYASRFQLLAGQREPGGTARNEVLDARRWGIGDERWFSWGLRIAGDAVSSSGKWSTLTQWRDVLSDGSAPGSPSVEIGLAHDPAHTDGLLQVTSIDGAGASLPVWSATATRDAWHWLVFRILFEPAGAGFIELYHGVDDEPLTLQELLPGGTRAAASTIRADATTQIKQGIYRDPTYAEDWTVWHRRLIATTDPADIPGLVV